MSPVQEPDAAAAIVHANDPAMRTQIVTSDPNTTQAQVQRPTQMRRNWSAEPGAPRFDKLGRRILLNSSNSRSGSAGNSTPGTPRRGDSDVRFLYRIHG